MLDGAADVSCRSHKIPQAVVISILGGSYGNHAPIMLSATCGSTGRKRTGSLGDCAGESSREKVQNVVTDSWEGGMGVLQVTGFAEKPRGVKIRYKLVNCAGAEEAPNNNAK